MAKFIRCCVLLTLSCGTITSVVDDAGVADGGAGGDGGASSTVASDFASLIASKNCPGFPNTPDTRLELTSSFQTGIDRGCGAFINQAYDCQKPIGATGLSCVNVLGVNDVQSNLFSCSENFTAAVACSVSVNDSRCYSSACAGDLDCPSGMACNDKTGHCFSVTQGCLGLPCFQSLDCAVGAACNVLLGVCVKS